jgi:hypothetical protein
MPLRIMNAKCCSNPDALCDECRAAAVAAASDSVPPARRLSDVLRKKSAKPATPTPAERLNQHGVPMPRSLSDVFRGAR